MTFWSIFLLTATSSCRLWPTALKTKHPGRQGQNVIIRHTTTPHLGRVSHLTKIVNVRYLIRIRRLLSERIFQQDRIAPEVDPRNKTEIRSAGSRLWPMSLSEVDGTIRHRGDASKGAGCRVRG